MAQQLRPAPSWAINPGPPEDRPHIGTLGEMIQANLDVLEDQAEVAAVLADMLAWYTVGYPAERIRAIAILVDGSVEDPRE